jgi:hypothetical protein
MAENGYLRPIPYVDVADHARLAIQKADQLYRAARGSCRANRSRIPWRARWSKAPAFAAASARPVHLDDVSGLLRFG